LWQNADVGKYRIINGQEIESSDDEVDVPVTISDIRGLSPGETDLSGRKVSGIRGIVPDKEVEANIEKLRDAMSVIGEPLSLEFDDDGTYRTVRKESVVSPSIKNTGVDGALRHSYNRMYFHDRGDGGYELSDNPIPLADRQELITERPPLDTLADEDEGETPITVVPPDFEG
jgi:hypothetical protein